MPALDRRTDGQTDRRSEMTSDHVLRLYSALVNHTCSMEASVLLGKSKIKQFQTLMH